MVTNSGFISVRTCWIFNGYTGCQAFSKSLRTMATSFVMNLDSIVVKSRFSIL